MANDPNVPPAPRDPAHITVETMMTADVLCIGADQTIRDAIDLLVKNEIGGAPVVDQIQRLVAVVSEGDLLMLAASEGMDKKIGACTGTINSNSKLVTVNRHDSFAVVYRAFIEHSVHRVIVVDANGAIHGIVSRSNVLRLLAESEEEKAS